MSTWLLLGSAGVAMGIAQPAPAQGKDESINDFFNVDGAGIQRLARQQQEVISACMRKQGFEYNVVGLGDFGDAITDSLDPEKFAEKYGYGVTTLINPDGSPASSASCASMIVLIGVFGAGLMTTAHPAANAGPSFQAAIKIG